MLAAPPAPCTVHPACPPLCHRSRPPPPPPPPPLQARALASRAVKLESQLAATAEERSRLAARASELEAQLSHVTFSAQQRERELELQVASLAEQLQVGGDVVNNFASFWSFMHSCIHAVLWSSMQVQLQTHAALPARVSKPRPP